MNAAPAWAETKRALVIGNDAYVNVSALRKATADAASVSRALSAIGFEVVMVRDATFSTFNAALSDFANLVKPGDTVLFYFAGHGFAIDNRNFLLPVDIPAARAGQADLVRRAAIASDEVTSSLRARGARTVVAILDACRDNPFAVPGQRSLAGTRGLAPIQAVEGEFVLLAAGAQQAALDRLDDQDANPNSVFTRVLLEALVQPGRNLVATAMDVREKVRELAATRNHRQTPAYYDDGAGTLILVPPGVPFKFESGGPDRIPGVPNAQEDEFWRSVQRGDTRTEYQAYLDKVAKGDFKGTYEALAKARVAAIDQKLREETAKKDQLRMKREQLIEAATRGPKRLVTAGNNGPTFVRGTFTRTGDLEWTEENTENKGNKIRFETVEQTPNQITILDRGRDMYLQLDLKNKSTRWRRGQQGNWNTLYDIKTIER